MDHPSPDQWIAYHRGELAAEEEARLQEHLVRCRNCFDLAEGAAAFAQPDAEPDAGQEVETAALWRLLRPQLDPPLASSSPENVREISAGPRGRPSRRFRLPSKLAAVFFVALVGLSAWSFHQNSLLKEALAPQPNTPIFEIAADERGTAGRELVAPAGPLMLVFHPAEDLPAYRLAIHDAATGRELPSHELRPNRNLNLALTLYLPEGLPPGRYRMELSDGAGKVLQTRLLRVTEPGRGD